MSKNWCSAGAVWRCGRLFKPRIAQLAPDEPEANFTNFSGEVEILLLFYLKKFFDDF
jgi:hypothetical protein